MIPENNSDELVEKQMIELQTKLAYQEDTVQALNDIVSEQQQDILALKNQVNLLLEELKGVLINLESGGISAHHETPPHY